MDDLTTVTYYFENGSKQISNINTNVLVNEKGRPRSKENINQIFEDTRHDLRAVRFEY